MTVTCSLAACEQNVWKMGAGKKNSSTFEIFQKINRENKFNQ